MKQKQLKEFQINDPMLALVNKQWQYYYSMIKNSIVGNEQEKEKIIRKRIIKFFGDENMGSESYFNPRRDINLSTPGIKLNKQKILLYGIDYLSKEKTLEYFKGFRISIKNLDDSHYIIEFSNSGECLKAFSKKNIKNIFFSSEHEVIHESFGGSGWIQFQPYFQIVFQRKLFARYQSSLDSYQDVSNRTKLQETYQKAKRKFIKNIKEIHHKEQRNFLDREVQKNRRNFCRAPSRCRCLHYQEQRQALEKQKRYNNYYEGKNAWKRNNERSPMMSRIEEKQKDRSRSREKYGIPKNEEQFLKYCKRREILLNGDESRKKKFQKQQKSKPSSFEMENKNKSTSDPLIDIFVDPCSPIRKKKNDDLDDDQSIRKLIKREVDLDLESSFFQLDEQINNCHL